MAWHRPSVLLLFPFILGSLLFFTAGCSESSCLWHFDDDVPDTDGVDGCVSVKISPNSVPGLQPEPLTLSIDGDFFNQRLWDRSDVSISFVAKETGTEALRISGSPPSELTYPPERIPGRRLDYSLKLNADQFVKIPVGVSEILVKTGPFANKVKRPTLVKGLKLSALPQVVNIPPSIGIGIAQQPQNPPRLLAININEGTPFVAAYDLMLSESILQIKEKSKQDVLADYACNASVGGASLFSWCYRSISPEAALGYLFQTKLSSPPDWMLNTTQAWDSKERGAKPDRFVLADSAGQRLVLWTNDSLSAFAVGSAGPSPVSGWTGPAPLMGSSGDLDGDGQPEFVLSTGDRQLRVLVGAETVAVDAVRSARLTTAWSALAWPSLGALAIGHLLGGGPRPQLVAIDRSAQHLQLFTLSGSDDSGWEPHAAFWPAVPLASDEEVVSLHIGDVDGDGANDLLIGTGNKYASPRTITSLWLLRRGNPTGME